MATKVSKKAINKYNSSVTYQSGRVGNVRYVEKGGETYTRSAFNSKKTNPRTRKQMLQRLRFRSLVNLYEALDLMNCFAKVGNQSDYNMYIRANQGMGVFLEKEEAEKGYQIALPIVITKGTGKIAPFEQSADGTQVVTSIALGSGFSISGSTKVSDLAKAIVDNNEDWDYDDRLGFVELLQRTVAGYPRVTMKVHTVTLTKDNDALLSSYMGADTLVAKDGMLASKTGLAAGCYGFTHSRKDTASKLDVSMQSLVNLNSALIDAYSTEDKFLDAWESYGMSEESWVDPDEGGEEGDTPEPSAVTLTVAVADTCTTLGNIQIGTREAAKTDSVTVEPGSIQHIKAIALSGNNFVGWSDGETDAERDITVSETKSITANFVED